jgi:hypothetical protein
MWCVEFFVMLSFDVVGVSISTDLGQAPCIVLNCDGSRHVFHIECLRTKLTKGWAGAGIDFSFLKCPLCESRVKHVAFDALIQPYLDLERKVQSLSEKGEGGRRRLVDAVYEEVVFTRCVAPMMILVC